MVIFVRFDVDRDAVEGVTQDFEVEQRFEVGLIAITDVQETQASYDQAVADALKSLGVSCEALSYYQQRPHPQRGLVLDINATGERELERVIAAVSQLGRDPTTPAPG